MLACVTNESRVAMGRAGIDPIALLESLGHVPPLIVHRASRFDRLAVTKEFERRRSRRDGSQLIGMNVSARGVVDGDEPGLIEVDDLLQRLDDLEDVISIARGECRQDDILGRVWSSERGRARPVSKPSHAAEV